MRGREHDRWEEGRGQKGGQGASREWSERGEGVVTSTVAQ